MLVIKEVASPTQSSTHDAMSQGPQQYARYFDPAGRDQRTRQCQPLAGGDERTVVYSLMLGSSATAAAATGRSRFPIGLKTLGESSSWSC
jgi:hypothetical protein